MAEQVTMADVMRHCRNDFAVCLGDVRWTMQDGRPLEWQLPPRAFLRYDGEIYRTDDTGRAPEWPDGVVDGRVWLLRPPADFLRLCEAIAAWARSHPRTGTGLERLGDYSTRGDNGWQAVFYRELAPWMRMFPPMEVRDGD